MTKYLNGPIGIFDSGVGGLSVLNEINKHIPDESLIYIADQIHVPYGNRSKKEIRKFATGIVKFLITQGTRLIVIACNTASAASLRYLRQNFPEIPFVGMEPAVKPAAEFSASRKVGILATPATFQGELYSSLVERYAQDLQIFQNTCPGLVNQIEMGELKSKETRMILESALMPMLKEGVDTIVLGCTHYPFVLPLIREIVGAEVRVIDPAPAISKRVEHVLNELYSGKSKIKEKSIRFFTTGNVMDFESNLSIYYPQGGNAFQLSWIDQEQELKILDP